MEDPLKFRERLSDTVIEARERSGRDDELAARLAELVSSEYEGRQVQEVIDDIQARALEAANEGECSTSFSRRWTSMGDAELARSRFFAAREFIGHAMSISLEHSDQVHWTNAEHTIYSDGDWCTTVVINFAEVPAEV